MKAKFEALNEREKWMVIVGGISLLLFVYYSLLYAPLSNSVTQKTKQLIEKSETLEWMKKVQGQSKGTKVKKKVDNSQLLTILSAQLKDNATLKFPYQLQQTGSGDIQLSFEQVPLKLFLTWLAKLNDQYTLSVKQLNVERTNTPGVTKLLIILSGE